MDGTEGNRHESVLKLHSSLYLSGQLDHAYKKNNINYTMRYYVASYS